MAHNNHFSAALFIALILFAASNPPKAAAQLPNLLGPLLNPVSGILGGIPLLGGLNLAGLLCCTSSGNCPGQPLIGASVNLNCTISGITRTVAQTITTANGTFTISLSPLLNLLLGILPLPCTLSVQLPIVNALVCPLLSNTTGILAAPVIPVGIVSSGTGLVQNAVPGIFTLVPGL